jgi:beta-1,4-mannosyl-glycoprotein beta-1,4-N-acetylglucosaminyltransferase
MKKIYDAFLFFNELEILELRMNILNDVVDHFVIVESTKTFSSKNKPLFFQDNKHLFEKFKDKIIHVIIENTPSDFIRINYIRQPITEEDNIDNKILKYVDESPGWDHTNPSHIQWGVETFQRESIIKGLINCNDEDIIIISDVDEIPNPNELIKLKENSDGVFNFNQNMYYYYLNMLKEINWSGPKACSWGKLKNISLNSLRQNKHTTNIINDGGWHFSFMGGENKIIEKLEAYAHQEYNTPFYKENVKNNMASNNDPFFRGELKKVNIDESYPKYILENIDKYVHMIKK